MDFLYTNLNREFLQRLGSRFLRRVDDELQKFSQALSDFFCELFENPKRDWRARFETFVAEEAVLGRQLSAESHAELVAYLELWEQSVFGEGASEAPAPEVAVVVEPDMIRDAGNGPVTDENDLWAEPADSVPAITRVTGVWGTSVHLNDDYFADSPFGTPCVVCHGVTSWGVVGPPNSFRLIGGVGSLEYLQNWRDTTTDVALAFGPEVAAWVSSLGGVLATATTATRSNAKLVSEIGSRANAWAVRKGISGTPQKLGIAKHARAQKVLNRYQQIFGDRGLRTEVSVISRERVPYGTAKSVRLDVIEGTLQNPTAIYDYKFGASGLSMWRVNQIRSIGGYPATPIIEVRP